MNGTSSTTQTQQQQVEAQNTSLTVLESDVDPFRPDDVSLEDGVWEINLAFSVIQRRRDDQIPTGRGSSLRLP